MAQKRDVCLLYTSKSPEALLRALMANYILEGVYFYSGFMFFYNLSRNGKMPGSAQEIRSINRDENTHLDVYKRQEPCVFHTRTVFYAAGHLCSARRNSFLIWF